MCRDYLISRLRIRTLLFSRRTVEVEAEAEDEVGTKGLEELVGDRHYLPRHLGNK